MQSEQKKNENVSKASAEVWKHARLLRSGSRKKDKDHTYLVLQWVRLAALLP
jgi:hypothetical protein